MGFEDMHIAKIYNRSKNESKLVIDAMHVLGLTCSSSTDSHFYIIEDEARNFYLPYCKNGDVLYCGDGPMSILDLGAITHFKCKNKCIANVFYGVKTSNEIKISNRLE